MTNTVTQIAPRKRTKREVSVAPVKMARASRIARCSAIKESLELTYGSRIDRANDRKIARMIQRAK